VRVREVALSLILDLSEACDSRTYVCTNRLGVDNGVNGDSVLDH
jgi:hypothetical protein